MSLKANENDKMDTSFMDSIMQSGIAVSGLESNGDVFYGGKIQGKEMIDDDLSKFLKQVGINEKEYRAW